MASDVYGELSQTIISSCATSRVVCDQMKALPKLDENSAEPERLLKDQARHLNALVRQTLSTEIATLKLADRISEELMGVHDSLHLLDVDLRSLLEVTISELNQDVRAAEERVRDACEKFDVFCWARKDNETYWAASEARVRATLRLDGANRLAEDARNFIGWFDRSVSVLKLVAQNEVTDAVVLREVASRVLTYLESVEDLVLPGRLEKQKIIDVSGKISSAAEKVCGICSGV